MGQNIVLVPSAKEQNGCISFLYLINGFSCEGCLHANVSLSTTNYKDQLLRNLKPINGKGPSINDPPPPTWKPPLMAPRLPHLSTVVDPPLVVDDIMRDSSIVV